MSETARPGPWIDEMTCGHIPADAEGDADWCGKPVAYRIRFAGWPAWQYAGACVEHAAEARGLDCERIWSVTS